MALLLWTCHGNHITSIFSTRCAFSNRYACKNPSRHREPAQQALQRKREAEAEIRALREALQSEREAAAVQRGPPRMPMALPLELLPEAHVRQVPLDRILKGTTVRDFSSTSNLVRTNEHVLVHSCNEYG